MCPPLSVVETSLRPPAWEELLWTVVEASPWELIAESGPKVAVLGGESLLDIVSMIGRSAQGTADNLSTLLDATYNPNTVEERAARVSTSSLL